jgi:adenosylhomocysteine nucleosidase
VAGIVTIDEVAITDPCLVFALRRESMFFRQAYPFQKRFPGAPCPALFRGTRDRSVLMVETGMGAAAMETAVRWCLGSPLFGHVPYRPRFLMLLGFSGALQPRLRLGDVVVASEIVDRNQHRWSATRLPVKTTLPITLGRILTVSEIVGDPRDKRELGRRYEALAVDMESAVAARLCHDHNVPFVCVRAISDDVDTALSPHLQQMIQRGKVSPFRLAAGVLRRPSLVGELKRLADHTRKAALSLLEAVSQYVDFDQRSS